MPYAVFEGQSDEPRPGTPWTLRFYSQGDTRFRSTFFDEHGSVRRVIWYEVLDERLFRSEVTEYTYDYGRDPGRRDEDECVLLTHGLFKPDGTGTLQINDKSAATTQRLSVDQMNVSGQWLDVPAFGDWSRLSDPGSASSST